MRSIKTSGAHGVECFWGEIKQHPQCSHGPTLLFGTYVNGKLKEFYSCSACRSRELCNFYLEKGNELPSTKKSKKRSLKKPLHKYKHRILFKYFYELMNMHPDKRCYCHKCEKLFPISEKDQHVDHEIIEGLTDYQMNHPTEMLKPLEDPKKEAQYLFSQKSTEDIIGMLVKLEAKQVLCIGAPRIHEYIVQHCDDKMASLLLDFDGRFHNFFGPLSFCHYNLFNHHFFTEEAEQVFKSFITQNRGKGTYLVCDPPFGGRVEPMSQTIKTIHDLHRKLNNIQDHDDELKIMFFFPYFMESIMREKSNPPTISGGLKDLKMSDYKVNYDNHPLFQDRKSKGSPVRIFTNIPLNILELPNDYKYCKKCQKWVSGENKHCKKCKECTSKDGRTYKHCDLCERCVKPTWVHCEKCDRCLLKVHKCGEGPKTTGRCSKCLEFGHLKKDCNNDNGKEKSIGIVVGKKRKLHQEDEKTTQQPTKMKKEVTNVDKEQMKNLKKVHDKNEPDILKLHLEKEKNPSKNKVLNKNEEGLMKKTKLKLIKKKIKRASKPFRGEKDVKLKKKMISSRKIT